MKGFQKLPEQLIENLALDGITALSERQEKMFAKIREGRNLIFVSKDSEELTQLFAWTTISKVPVPEEGSPRAIIVCANDQQAIERTEQLKKWAKRMDLTLDLAIEKGNKLQQRNDIFDGTEIVIGTTKRIYDLYIQNGINLNMLRLFIIEDAHEVFKGYHPGFLLRIGDSLPKCQILMSTIDYNSKIEHFHHEMPFAFQVIETEKV